MAKSTYSSLSSSLPSSSVSSFSSTSSFSPVLADRDHGHSHQLEDRGRKEMALWGIQVDFAEVLPFLVFNLGFTIITGLLFNGFNLAWSPGSWRRTRTARTPPQSWSPSLLHLPHLGNLLSLTLPEPPVSSGALYVKLCNYIIFGFFLQELPVNLSQMGASPG